MCLILIRVFMTKIKIRKSVRNRTSFLSSLLIFLLSPSSSDGVTHGNRARFLIVQLTVVLGMVGDNIDELVTELARTTVPGAAVPELAASHEVAENQAHLLAGGVVTKRSTKVQNKRFFKHIYNVVLCCEQETHAGI